jgi:hypothetical protein
MSLSVSSEVYDRYVKITVTGEWELLEVLKLIGTVRAMCQSAQRSNVLVDMCGVEGDPSDPDRFWAGKQTALALGHEVKVAIVSRAERINKLAQNAAVDRGAHLIVVPTEQEAVVWLESD